MHSARVAMDARASVPTKAQKASSALFNWLLLADHRPLRTINLDRNQTGRNYLGSTARSASSMATKRRHRLLGGLRRFRLARGDAAEDVRELPWGEVVPEVRGITLFRGIGEQRKEPR
jgi:hypothetical protein